jgi:hypothetical protein
MAISSREARELLTYIRRTLQELGSAELDTAVMGEVRWGGNAAENLNAYLRLLLQVLAERSRESYDQALSRIQNHVRLADGGEVKGIRVVLTPDEVEFYNVREVTLAEAPDYRQLSRDLESYIRDLTRDLDLGRGGPSL